MSFDDFSPFLNAFFWAPKKKNKKNIASGIPGQVLAHGCIGSASVRISVQGDKGEMCIAKNPPKKRWFDV